MKVIRFFFLLYVMQLSALVYGEECGSNPMYDGCYVAMAFHTTQITLDAVVAKHTQRLL